MTHLKPILLAATLALAAIPAQAGSISFDFDGGAQGWRLIDRFGDRDGTGNVLTAQSTDGASGGYLAARDRTGGNMQLVAPAILNGDLRRFIGGDLSFMLREVGSTRAGARPSTRFGEVTLHGNGRTLRADGFRGLPTDDWRPGGVTLSAESFRVDEATFRDVLSDVSLFSINVESRIGLVETTGIDSVTVAPIPLPAGAVFLFAALAGLGVLRLRRKPPVEV